MKTSLPVNVDWWNLTRTSQAPLGQQDPMLTSISKQISLRSSWYREDSYIVDFSGLAFRLGHEFAIIMISRG